MLKKLEVISGSVVSQQSEELYRYRDGDWDRQFILKPRGPEGEYCVRCDWESSAGVELVFASLADAREEIERLAQYPREWFEKVLRPVRVANG